MDAESKTEVMPFTVYYCKYGKPDKAKPIEVNLGINGELNIPNDVTASWAKTGCSGCSGTGTMRYTQGGNTYVQSCPCAVIRLKRHIPEDIVTECIARQKKSEERMKAVKEKMPNKIPEDKLPNGMLGRMPHRMRSLSSRGAGPFVKPIEEIKE
jgi:hypothetical protein